MTQKVSLYGALIEVTDGTALGILSFSDGKYFAADEMPLGFAMTPPDVDDEWRHGYALGVFGLEARI